MSKIVIIDSQVAGISGDMFLSSLVDIGANKKKSSIQFIRAKTILSALRYARWISLKPHRMVFPAQSYHLNTRIRQNHDWAV